MKKNNKHSVFGDSLITLAFLLLALSVCWFFNTIPNLGINIPSVNILCILFISILTNGYAYGIIASAVAMFFTNYFFIYPYKCFNFSITGYPISTFFMLLISLLSSAMTAQIKESNQNKIEAEREKTKVNLLRTISHDFRTPMTSIICSLNMLGNEKLGKKEKQKYISNAINEAEWLVSCMENILSITKINDNPQDCLLKDIQVAEEIISEAVSKFSKHFPNYKVSVYVPDDLVFVNVDASLIEQVITNILQNSVIHGKKAKASKITLSVRNKLAEFSIEDNGSGIPQDVLPLIFTSTKLGTGDSTRGSGLGLSLCSTIIQAHGGTIKAENIMTGGARVIFTLPVYTNIPEEK